MKVKSLTASAVWNMLRQRQTKLTVTKYGVLQVYKLTTYLFSLAKSLPLKISYVSNLPTSSNEWKFEEYSVLKVYWLSCNNSCAEISSPLEYAKNWFLKRRLDTNLCQVLIDVKYMRDWQLCLKKMLQDSLVNPVISTTQKISFPLRIYLIFIK